MKAITLWEPWASLMAREFKRCETRSWPLPESLKNKPVAIHAAKKWTVKGDESQLQIAKRPEIFDRLKEHWGDYSVGQFRPDTLGKVLCVVRFVSSGTPTFLASGKRDWQKTFGRKWRDQTPPMEPEIHFGDHSRGRQIWLSEFIYRLAEPISAKGGQGIWNLPQDAKDRIEQELFDFRLKEGVKILQDGGSPEAIDKLERKLAKDWILVEDENGHRKHVNRASFVRAMLRMIRDFGYSATSVDTVETSIQRLENQDGVGNGHDVLAVLLRPHVVFPQGDGPE